jgi:hypothetical protein
MERCVVYTCRCKVVRIEGEVTAWRKVRGNIGYVRRDRNLRREMGLLPPRGRLCAVVVVKV